MPLGGTKISNPVPSSGESLANSIFGAEEDANTDYAGFMDVLVRLTLISLDCCAALIGSMLFLAPAAAQFSGHGGPIRTLAITADGATALPGSFDTLAIRWSLLRDAAEEVLRLHEGAVNFVAILQDGRTVTAGEDARIAIWTRGRQEPEAILRDCPTVNRRGTPLAEPHRGALQHGPRHPPAAPV